MSSPERSSAREREQEVFHAALAASPAERAELVRAACSGDGALERRVLRLVAAHERAAGSTELAVAPPLARKDPERVGPYGIVERIGDGGMGVVYLAEQTQPIRRRVALKVIKAGMDTEEVIARFHSERQALALMDHPSIARIFDSGATPEGRPYFVMEYVRGETLIAYCDGRELPLPERIELFVAVCRAVQHAHQKGIIHRDLKPSNVLVSEVDGKPVPKVIDFGIARAIDPGEGASGFTQVGNLVGTPAYMSPEQIDPRGRDVDTRSDVYSLGVLLYELLTGSLPFDLPERPRGGLSELLRLVREEEPPRPSTRMSSLGEEGTGIAERRGTSSARLATHLRGDLDRVVMKALEKDRARRYATAEGLALDLERYLAHEPVTASPPSTAYLVSKFVARHRGLVIAASLVATALVLGTIGTAIGAVRAGRERARAEQRALQADAAAARAVAARDFLTGILMNANPLQSLRKDVRARDLLAEAAQRLDAGEFADDPDTAFEMRATLGSAFASIDQNEDAERQLRLAFELLPRTATVAPLDRVRLRLELAEVQGARGDFAGSRASAREGLAGLDAAAVGEHELRIRALNLLSNADYNSGSTGDAVAEAREALAMSERFGESRKEATESLRLMLAFLLVRQGALDEAMDAVQRALPVLQNGSPRARVDAAFGLRQRADIQYYRGRYGEAELDLREALKIREGLFDEASVPLADILNDLAMVEYRTHQLDDAELHGERALEVRRALLGEHRDTATTLVVLADVAGGRGDVAKARDLNLEALEMRRRVLGDGSPAVADSLRRLGQREREGGELEAAERHLREALPIFERAQGDDHTDTIEVRYELGRTLRDEGRLEEAREPLRAALEACERTLGPGNSRAKEARDALVTVLLDVGDYDEAEALIQRGLELVTAGPLGRRQTIYLRAQLGAVRRGQERFEEAEELLLEGWQAIGSDPQVWPENKLFLLEQLAKFYEAIGDPAEAQVYRERAEAFRR